MKKKYVIAFLIITVLIWLISEDDKNIVIDSTKEVEKIVSPIISKKSKTIKKVLENNKSKIEQKEIKYCNDSIVYYNGKEDNTIAKILEFNSAGFPLQIEVGKDSANSSTMIFYNDLDDYGNIHSQDIDADGDGELDYGEEFIYDNNGKLEKSTHHIYSDEPVDLVNNIIYNEDNSIKTIERWFKSDMNRLTKVEYSSYAESTEIEYHEEYDENGNVIFAYSNYKGSPYILKSYSYTYDEEEHLLSKTFRTHSNIYDSRYVPVTVIFDKKGRIQKTLRSKNDNFRNLNVKNVNEIFSSQNMENISSGDIFDEYIYNEKDELISIIGKFNDKNITYEYDDYGNAIKTFDKGKLIEEHHFKICD